MSCLTQLLYRHSTSDTKGWFSPWPLLICPLACLPPGLFVQCAEANKPPSETVVTGTFVPTYFRSREWKFHTWKVPYMLPDTFADFVRSYVEVVKSLSYCSIKLVVFSTQTKPLTTNIHEMYNKVWLLQHLRVSNHVISPHLQLQWSCTKIRTSYNTLIPVWQLNNHNLCWGAKPRYVDCGNESSIIPKRQRGSIMVR